VAGWKLLLLVAALVAAWIVSRWLIYRAVTGP